MPNVAMIPVADAEATWDLFLVWQRGKTAGRSAPCWMRFRLRVAVDDGRKRIGRRRAEMDRLRLRLRLLLRLRLRVGLGLGGEKRFC